MKRDRSGEKESGDGMTETKFTRMAKLVGDKVTEYLSKKRVLIIGIGGVGGMAAEALVRSNLGCVHIVDCDIINISNTNRQIIALESTIGKRKVDVLKQRLLDINNQCDVQSHFKRVDCDNIASFDFGSYDMIVDAIDDIAAKETVIRHAVACSVPVISAMGAGNHLDAMSFKTAPLSKTYNCPLARAMRRRLADDPIASGIPVVFSTEKPVLKTPDFPASISFVPPAAGLLLAQYVVLHFAKECQS